MPPTYKSQFLPNGVFLQSLASGSRRNSKEVISFGENSKAQIIQLFLDLGFRIYLGFGNIGILDFQTIYLSFIYQLTFVFKLQSLNPLQIQL